jgi:cold shock CspA family protein
MALGEILWFDAERGFGFIRPDMGPRDVFVHASALAETGMAPPRPGTRVEFELVQMLDGRLAAQRLHLPGLDRGAGPGTARAGVASRPR